MDMKLRQKWVSDVERYTEYRTAINSFYYKNVSKIFERRRCHRLASSVLLQPSDIITELYDIAAQAKYTMDSILTTLFGLHDFEVNVFRDNVVLDRFLAANELQADGSYLSEDPEDIHSYNYLITMPLKPKDAAFNKAINEYNSRANINRVLDVVRSSVICNSEDHLAFVLDLLLGNSGRAAEETGAARYDVVSCKNRFRHPNFTGYRDVLLTLRVEVAAADVTRSAPAPRSTNASAASVSAASLAIAEERGRDATGLYVFYCEVQLHLLSLFLFETRTHRNVSRAFYTKYREFFVVPECFHEGEGEGEGEGDGDEGSVVAVAPEDGAEMDLGLSAPPSPERGSISQAALPAEFDEPESEPGSPLRPKRSKKPLSLRLYEYRCSILRKMAQAAADVTQLEELVESFLTGPARRNRDLDRLRAYRDLLQLTGEENLCEQVQIYIIKYLKEFYYASVKEFKASGGVAAAKGDGRLAMSARSHVLLVETAMEISRQAKHYKSCKRYEEALPLCLEALELCEKLHGRDHPATAKELTDLGTLLYCQGRFADATPVFERACSIRKTVLGAAHVETLLVLVFYADALYDNGQLPEALAQYEELVEVQMLSLGEDAPDVTATIVKMADIHRELGRMQQAVDLHLQALHKRLSFFGEEHPVTAESLSCLAVLADMQGLHVAALEYHQRALEIRETALGDAAAETGESYQAVAELCLVLQRNVESVALPYAERAVEVITRWYEEAYPFGYKLGAAATPAVSQTASRAATARPGTTAVARGRGGHPLLASALQVYAEVLLRLGRLSEAHAVVDRALQMRKEVCGGKSSAVMQSVGTQGVVVAMLKRARHLATTTEGSRPSSPQSIAAAAAAAGGSASASPPKIVAAGAEVYDVKKESNITFINVERSGEPGVAPEQAPEEHVDDIVVPHQQLDHHANQGHINLCDADDCREAGAFDRAVPLYRAVIDSLLARFGPLHPTLGVAYTHLGLCYEDMERYAEAEAQYRRALGIAQAAFCGRDFEGSCASSIYRHCAVETRTSRVAATLTDPVAYSEALPEDTHPTVAGALTNLANVCLLQKKYQDALPLLCEAFRVQVLLLTEAAAGSQVVFPPEEASFAMASVVEGSEDAAAADAHEDRLGESDEPEPDLGEGEEPEERPVAAATPAAPQGVELQEDPLVTDAERRLFVRTTCGELVLLQYALAQCYYGSARPHSSFRLVELVLANRLSMLQTIHAEALGHGGAELLEGGGSRPATGAETRPATGAETRPATGADTRPATGADVAPPPPLNLKADPDYTAALNLKFLLLIELDQWEAAQTLGNEVKQLREALCGVSHPAYAVALNNLGVLQYTKRDFAKAGVLLDTSLDVRERTLGVSAEDALMAMNNLATVLAEQEQAQLRAHSHGLAQAPMPPVPAAQALRATMQEITSFKVTYVAKPPTAVN